jgi:hypothetical protein
LTAPKRYAIIMIDRQPQFPDRAVRCIAAPLPRASARFRTKV